MTRRVVPPQGVRGGRAGRPARLLVNEVEHDPVAVKTLHPGDRVTLETAGGGGFGPPPAAQSATGPQGPDRATPPGTD